MLYAQMQLFNSDTKYHQIAGARSCRRTRDTQEKRFFWQVATLLHKDRPFPMVGWCIVKHTIRLSRLPRTTASSPNVLHQLGRQGLRAPADVAEKPRGFNIDTAGWYHSHHAGAAPRNLSAFPKGVFPGCFKYLHILRQAAYESVRQSLLYIGRAERQSG